MSHDRLMAMHCCCSVERRLAGGREKAPRGMSWRTDGQSFKKLASLCLVALSLRESSRGFNSSQVLMCWKGAIRLTK